MIRLGTITDTQTFARPIRGLADYERLADEVALDEGWIQEHLVGAVRRGAARVAVARIAVECGCGRLEWAVLDRNEPAVRFYRSLGTVPLDEWTAYRLTREALTAAASGPGEGSPPAPVVFPRCAARRRCKGDSHGRGSLASLSVTGAPSEPG
jgi:hypothetical protein